MMMLGILKTAPNLIGQIEHEFRLQVHGKNTRKGESPQSIGQPEHHLSHAGTAWRWMARSLIGRLISMANTLKAMVKYHMTS
jgi:hypothetical protein